MVRFRIVQALEELKALDYCIKLTKGTTHEAHLRRLRKRVQAAEKRRLGVDDLGAALRDAAVLRGSKRAVDALLTPKAMWWGGVLPDNDE